MEHPADYPRTHSDITIIGAGICGLATAIALGRKGISVTVLENRLHPESDLGQSIRQEMNIGLQAINRLTDEPQTQGWHSSSVDSDRELRDISRKVAQQRRKLWGVFERSIVIDGHTLQFLADLGMDTANIPACQLFEMRTQPGMPEFAVTQTGRTALPSGDGLSTKRLLLQRDWAAQPSLGHIERLLHDVTGRYPNIDVVFGATIEAITVLDEVTLSYAVHTKGQTLNSHLLLVADGSGDSDFSNALGVKRTVHHREDASIAVFDTQPGEQFGTRPANDVFTSIELMQDSVFSIATNGATATCASVNLRGTRTDALDALRKVRRKGMVSKLSEPPLKITVEVSSLDKYVGKNWAFIGDAAVAGNPRFGLGAQYGALWAQEVANCIPRIDAESIETGLKQLNLFALDLSSRRTAFELASLELHNLYNIHTDTFVEKIFSPAQLENVSSFTYDAKRTGSKLSLRFGVECRFDTRQPVVADPVDAIFDQIGDLKIEGKLTLKVRGHHLLANIGAHDHVVLSMGDIRLQLIGGVICIERRKRSWFISVRDGKAINSYSDDTYSTPDPGLNPSAQSLNFTHISFVLDDTTINGAMHAALMKTGNHHLNMQATTVDISLSEGLPLSLGHMQVTPIGETVIRYAVGTNARGRVQILIRVMKGKLMAKSFVSWSKGSKSGLTRPLKALSFTTGGRIDGTVDKLSALGSTMLQSMVIEMRAGGCAKITLNLGFPLSVMLTAEEFRELVDDLTNGLVNANWSDFHRAIKSVSTNQ